MTMESRSVKISNVPSMWVRKHNPTLITVKRGIFYYEDPEDKDGGFCAVKGGELFKTSFYGLDDVELFG